MGPMTAQSLLETIEQITREKQENGRYPEYALSIEILRRCPGLTELRLNQIAKELIDSGRVIKRDTLNYDAYQITTPNAQGLGD